MYATIRKIVFGLVLGLLLAGCSTRETPRPDAPAPVASAPVSATQVAATAITSSDASAVNAANSDASALNDPKHILSGRSVYFEYDKAEIKPSSLPLVSAHARYLQEHPDARMVIQGNTDERGSREYNLALGQRRSDAIVKLMRLQGVRDQQMEAVSFGEEKPRATAHDEAAWTENRRCDLLYTRIK